MADPHQEARALIDALTADLLALIDQSWTQIHQAEQQLISDWLTLTETQRTARIRALRNLATDLMATVRERTQGALPEMLQTAYDNGALQIATVLTPNAAPQLIQADHDLVSAIISDTWTDVLAATQLVTASTKEMVRDLAREAAALRFEGVATAERAGQVLANAMAGKGITAIVYRDGSRHGLDDYANMLLRTKTAETYQVGGFDLAERLGVTFMQVLDNPSCGLTSHDDPLKANGLVLPLAEARLYPLSHPRCVRATTARPDIVTPAQARAASPLTTAAQDEDQRLVERTRADASARRQAAQRVLNARLARNRRGLLTPSAGAAGSAAARRNAARVARRGGAA